MPTIEWYIIIATLYAVLFVISTAYFSVRIKAAQQWISLSTLALRIGQCSSLTSAVVFTCAAVVFRIGTVIPIPILNNLPALLK